MLRRAIEHDLVLVSAMTELAITDIHWTPVDRNRSRNPEHDNADGK